VKDFFLKLWAILKPHILYPEEHPSIIMQPLPMQDITPVKQNLLEIFIQEIKNMEGWYVGSASYLNKNCGNLRCDPNNKSNWNVLAIGSNDGFCVFKSEEAGMMALRNVTVSQAKGLSPTYNNAAKHFGLANSGELNLYQYFLIRDPATDGNQPNALAERFGKVLHKDPALFRLKNLLS